MIYILHPFTSLKMNYPDEKKKGTERVINIVHQETLIFIGQKCLFL
jgi:hypothetical protein